MDLPGVRYMGVRGHVVKTNSILNVDFLLKSHINVFQGGCFEKYFLAYQLIPITQKWFKLVSRVMDTSYVQIPAQQSEYVPISDVLTYGRKPCWSTRKITFYTRSYLSVWA